MNSYQGQSVAVSNFQTSVFVFQNLRDSRTGFAASRLQHDSSANALCKEKPNHAEQAYASRLRSQMSAVVEATPISNTAVLDKVTRTKGSLSSKFKLIKDLEDMTFADICVEV